MSRSVAFGGEAITFKRRRMAPVSGDLAANRSPAFDTDCLRDTGGLALEFHLERKIRLSEASKYKSLYKWCLQELDEDGNQIGADQIPSEWSHHFTGNNLAYSTSIGSVGLPEDEDNPSELCKMQEFIFATLRPGVFRGGKWENATEFSMFGTKRTIRHFCLRIEKLKRDDPSEGCRIWGSASYTFETDHRDETTDDAVEVHLFISTDKFDRIADMIRKNEVDALHLHLGRICGFYSEWSPSVNTTRVKLLAADSAQQVMCREDCDIVPPRLGDVGEFDLQVIRRCVLDPQQNIEGGNVDELDSVIANTLQKYLEKHLPKPSKDEANRWSFYSQFNEIAKQVGRRIAEYSKSRGENSDQFEDRLQDAFDVLTSIRYATNEQARDSWLEDDESKERMAEREKAKHTIWFHGDALFAFQQGYESEYARKVEVEPLQQEARKYLLRPWMENEQLEWIIVDALAFSTVTSFGEELKQYTPGPVSFLGLNMGYFSAKGDVHKMLWKQIEYGLIKFVVKVATFLGAPIALGWYFFNRGREGGVLIAGTIYAALLMLYVVYRALRRMFGKKSETIVEKYQDVLNDMFLTYDMLKGEVISPTAVRAQLLDTARRGAVWPGAMFSILDHAIRRNPAVWGNAECDTYRH